MSVAPAIDVVTTRGFADYALLDSGGGRKLERFGSVVVDRPEPQALWRPRLPEDEWRKAHAVFSASGEDDEKGKWRVDKPVPESWPVRVALDSPPPRGEGSGVGGRPTSAVSPSPPPGLPHKGGGEAQPPVTMLCRLAGLWHLGLFPEQVPHWQWMAARLHEITPRLNGEAPRVLNLFGYTGAASLLAAAAGAQVTHVDASKKAVTWARENQAASKLADKPIRWIVDDAQKFVAREVRRGRTYHMILVDPPKYGRGPEGETWDLFPHLPGLLDNCAALLERQHAAMILTVYAIRASAIAFDQLMRERLSQRGGRFHTGELAILEERGTRAVPTSLFTRWVSDVA